MKQVYLAGSLFSEREVAGRLTELAIAEQELPNIKFFSPIAAPFNQDKSSLPTPIDIYEGDLEQIKKSSYVIFDMGDQLDPGLNLEIGLVAAMNEILDSKIQTIAVISDIRAADANKYQIPSFSMNHMVLGALEKHGVIVASFGDALEHIKNMEGL